MSVVLPKPMRRRPRVSVVVPHYNYGAYLPVAVASARHQRGLELEIIVVDDHSTDGSVAVARAVAAAHENVVLVEHERNRGHIATYNDGLARATGDYVVLLSADDALTPDSLTRSVALMEAHPGVGLVYGGVDSFRGDPPAVRARRGWWRIWPGDQWIARLAHRGRNAVVNPEAVLRREVYAGIGGYDAAFPHAADMYLWLRAAARSDVGFVAGPRQAAYRVHDANMHSTRFGGVLDDMTQVLDVYERFFAADGARVPDAARLLAGARRAVAREALLRAALLRAEGAPESAVAELQRFARVTAPGIERAPVWRWADLALRSHAAARVIGAAESARWKVRSRRQIAVGL